MRLPSATQAALWLLLLLSNFSEAPGHSHGHAACDHLDMCTKAYDDSLESRGLTGPEASAAFCGVLYDFGICMHNIRKLCRGNLNYHTSNSMLIHLKKTFDCARRLQQEGSATGGLPHRRPPATSSTPSPQGTTTPSASPVAEGECGGGVHGGTKSFRHCGLFGDPHLKTFRGHMQTCRVQGAWPLVDNRFLAVQVTNEPVLQGSSATATTKVTVLVKGSATPCLNQTKTYEATAEAPLPVSFIDGTNKSGSGDAVTITYQETAFGSSVQIQIRYIETTVIVRKVGNYLAFSTRMPEALVQEVDGVQLCVEGCPLSERMDLKNDRGHVLSWTDALAKCVAKVPSTAQVEGQRSPGVESAEAIDLTDQYLDWCVFDLMTTGKEDFVWAARSAHRDTLDMDPGAAGTLRNRTTAQDVGTGTGGPAASTTGSAAAASSSGLLCLLLLCLLRY